MSATEFTSEAATFAFDRGVIEASQRIGAVRPVARLTFPSAPWRADGPARLVRGDAAVDIRGDGVLIVRAARPLALRVDVLFRADYDESARGARLVLDGHGGFGVYRSGAGRRGARAKEIDLRAGDELWLSVCPPRAPSPLREAEEIAHEGRPRPFPDAAYPSADIVEDAARHCRVFALHAYFWASGPRRLDLSAGRYALRRRPWTAARHEPADPERFRRLAADVRRAGMKLVLYVSPRHSTAPDIDAEMRRVVREYHADGLYLDGLPGDFRARDAFLRRARAAVGADRVLYLNASDGPFGTPRVRCPFVDAQADYVLRGDAGRGGLSLARFLRYAVSGRAIDNSVGVWCHYGSAGRPVLVESAPPLRHVDAARAHGARLWRRSIWGAKALAEFDARYYGVPRA